jgi:hypothetical protein
MSKFFNKISNLINSQVPEFVLDDHPKFVEFLKAYYTFLESAELTLENIQSTEGILLESETGQTDKLLLNSTKLATDRKFVDAGDKIIFEDSLFGKFTQGETIIGEQSKATATILTVDLENNRLFISAQDKFIMGENVIGSTSNAVAVINFYRPNPVENIQDLLNYRDIDKVVDNFLTHFQYEFLNTLPQNLNPKLDKHTIIKSAKFLYGLKGTKEGNDLFFRLLFGERADTVYPREQILRVSDGKWGISKIIRTIDLTGDTTNLIGRTIVGLTSGTIAIIEDVRKFQIGADNISEIILNNDTLSGDFIIGEQIIGTQYDTDTNYIRANITGLPSVPTVLNSGSLYSDSESISIIGGGEGAIVQIESIGHGNITDFFINSSGINYKIGDDIVFNNENTNGGAAQAKVAIVNGGILLENSIGDIIFEDATTAKDSYSGNILIQEYATGVGDITKIRLINSGFNYTSLPLLTVTSTSGSGASILAYGDEIGRILSFKIVEAGKGYENSPTPPALDLPVNILYLNLIGEFFIGETVSGLANDNITTITGVVKSINNTTNIITLKNVTGTFAKNVTLTGLSSGASATIKIFNQASATTSTTAILNTSGSYINQDGWVSEDTMKIEDNLIYQDFSYIIKTGQSINVWRDSFKKTMHSAGFYVRGEVNIKNNLDARIRPITGKNTNETFNPIQSIISYNTFNTIFGRRLGTLNDGSSLNPTPNVISNTGLTKKQRDVTIRQSINYILQNKPRLSIRGYDTIQGYVVAGPQMRNVNRFKFTTFSGSGHPQTSTVGRNHTTATYITPMNFTNWSDLKIIGTGKSNINGTSVQMQDINITNLKTYVALPTEITVTQP